MKWNLYFLGCLIKEKNKYKIMVPPTKTITNLKERSGSRIIISVTASLSVTGRFSPVSTPHWMQEKSA